MRYNKSKRGAATSPNWRNNASEDQITKQYYRFMECMLAASKDYIFPNAICGGNEPPIGSFDTMNGYKFLLSFHLFESNQYKLYWYLNRGSLRFELEDMTWLWPNYFVETSP